MVLFKQRHLNEKPVLLGRGKLAQIEKLVIDNRGALSDSSETFLGLVFVGGLGDAKEFLDGVE